MAAWTKRSGVTATSGPLTRALISQQVYRSGGSGTFWAVDDAIAKLIVKAFYENMFKDSKNDESATRAEDGFHSYRRVVLRRILVVWYILRRKGERFSGTHGRSRGFRVGPCGFRLDTLRYA
ncbi:hypothetical protein C8R48DRAFT_777771 [Suillus tomentosus]|nr:hypothetical protein C8R48DRAFT_777771 [Suillus tomentosus]